MKILNLYAGIGGNRKLWSNEHQITAIENNEEIAKIYQEFYPNDKIIVTDAHDYLLEHYKKYDFIWSSPPCPTHSEIRRCGVHAGQYPVKYPDMKLYEEIIMLKYFSKCKWVIENVRPYYKLLIKPMVFLDRHIFWSNFIIHPQLISNKRKVAHENISTISKVFGISLKDRKLKTRKNKILRNMVNPEIGKYILEQAQYKDELFKELQ